MGSKGRINKDGVPIPVRTMVQKYNDFRVESKMYLQGHSQEEISEKVGISQAQVSNDLREIREHWKKSALIDFNERIAHELNKIDDLELMYIEGYDRSLKKKESITKKVVPMIRNEETGRLEVTQDGELINQTRQNIHRVVVEETTKTETSVGDPRWLDGVAKCIDMRLKIFGVGKTTGQQGQGVSLPPDAHEARIALFYAIFERFSGNGNGNGNSQPD